MNIWLWLFSVGAAAVFGGALAVAIIGPDKPDGQQADPAEEPDTDPGDDQSFTTMRRFTR